MATTNETRIFCLFRVWCPERRTIISCVCLCVVSAHTCGTDRRGGACWRSRRRSLTPRRAASLRFKCLLRQKGALKSPWPQTYIDPEDMQTYEEGSQRTGRLSTRRKPCYADRVKYETNQTCWCVAPTQRKEKRKEQRDLLPSVTYQTAERLQALKVKQGRMEHVMKAFWKKEKYLAGG